MIPKAPKKQSALDLTIKGSMGDFVVSQGDVSSVRVHYLLSHIGLELEGDHQERLLSRIAPFREVFDPRTLDFDQIMQRDIDDARVSTELIPYLLEQADAGLVKLFPPIIVVLLPTDSTGKPAPHYPKVEEATSEQDEQSFNVVRSGAIGQEVFELRRWLVEGVPQSHDFAELRINTNRCKLVIVDGQHRAMSLLALYRNIKCWPERTRNIEPYYRIWTPARIAKFDLERARMPIMFCVFPQLDGQQPGMELKVHSACRSIFLALNKSARPVTRSRNILLDDRDVVAMFLRGILGYVKDLDIGSPETIRLSAIELDNDKDRSVLKSPVSISGVTHLNGLVERLMLGAPPPPGLTVRPQNLWLSKKLDKCFARFAIQDQLTPDAEKRVRRDSCDRNTMSILETAFAEVYLPVIIRGLDAFAPYRVHHEAAAALHSRLETGTTADFYRAILFEGEGMNRVFAEFQKRIDEMLEDDEFATPELRQTREEFHSRQKSLDKEISDFQGDRAARFLSGVPRALGGRMNIRGWVTDELYSDTLTTAAFQNALFLTFFGVVEQINIDRSKSTSSVGPLTKEEVLTLFDGYLDDLNTFFLPKKQEGLANLVAVFLGDLRPDGSLIATNFSLKKVLLSTELKPDEWPKFRAMLQELWRPLQPEAATLLLGHRKLLRRQALEHYIKREVSEFCKDKAIREIDLSEAAREKIEETCAERLAKGLGALGADVSREDLLKVLRLPPSGHDEARAGVLTSTPPTVAPVIEGVTNGAKPVESDDIYVPDTQESGVRGFITVPMVWVNLAEILASVGNDGWPRQHLNDCLTRYSDAIMPKNAEMSDSDEDQCFWSVAESPALDGDHLCLSGDRRQVDNLVSFLSAPEVGGNGDPTQGLTTEEIDAMSEEHERGHVFLKRVADLIRQAAPPSTADAPPAALSATLSPP